MPGASDNGALLGARYNGGALGAPHKERSLHWAVKGVLKAPRVPAVCGCLVVYNRTQERRHLAVLLLLLLQLLPLQLLLLQLLLPQLLLL